MVQTIQVLRYLGNKRSILDFLLQLNDTHVIKPGETLVDVFAGTHSVGYAFKQRGFPVIANDVQEYSATIGKAIIENKRYEKINKKDIKEVIKLANKNYAAIKKIKGIKKNQYTDRATKNHPINKFYKKQNKKFPYCLFSYYYRDKFFTADACMKIDSIRYGVDKVAKKNGPKKAILLTALMQVLSKLVLSTGHFAQYRENGDDLKRIKEKNAFRLFEEMCGKFTVITNKNKNRAFNKEYKKFLSSQSIKKVAKKGCLFYLDPPYSNANYSRYYHIPETLVKYDYPECNGKGCYREDRHFSNFSKSSKAKEEFEYLLKKINALGPNAKVALSYSDKGLIKLNELVKVCKKNFKTVEVKKLKHKHSSMGKKMKSVKEMLIICRNGKP